MYGRMVTGARRARGLSQVELAEISGIGQANISAIERGRREPSSSTLHRLLHACGFELTATAGSRTVAPGPPLDDPFFTSLLERSAFDEAPTVTASTPPEVRAAALVAALDLAESLVRSKRR